MSKESQAQAIQEYMAIGVDAQAVATHLMGAFHGMDNRLRLVLLLRDVACRIEKDYRNHSGGRPYVDVYALEPVAQENGDDEDDPLEIGGPP